MESSSAWGSHSDSADDGRLENVTDLWMTMDNPLAHRPPHSQNNRQKTNMRHIHTSIISRHLATRGNNKILRTPPPHISSSDERHPASLVAPLHNSEQTNLPSSNHTYTTSTPNHIHHHYAPYATPTHTPSLQLHPHTHHTVTPWIYGQTPLE